MQDAEACRFSLGKEGKEGCYTSPRRTGPTSGWWPVQNDSIFNFCCLREAMRPIDMTYGVDGLLSKNRCLNAGRIISAAHRCRQKDHQPGRGGLFQPRTPHKLILLNQDDALQRVWDDELRADLYLVAGSSLLPLATRACVFY